MSKFIIVTVAIPRGANRYPVSFPAYVFSTDTEKQYYRPDLKVTAIIDGFSRELNSRGFNVARRVVIYGFSNGGMFANRFSLLHPDRVRAVAIGQAGGALTFPLKSYGGTQISWPAGVYDYPFINKKVFRFQEYALIPKYIFIGELDTGPYQSTVYSSVYGWNLEIFSLEQCQFMYGIATTDPERVKVQSGIMKAAGDNVTFKMYPGIGHLFTEEWWNDVKTFLEKNSYGSNAIRQ